MSDPEVELTSFDSIIERYYGPRGAPEREQFEAAVVRQHQRTQRIEHLVGWLYRLPPRWVHQSDEFMTEYWGPGPLAYQFWADFLTGIYDGRAADERRRDHLGRCVYSACDAVAWRFLDDIYVPHLADLQAGVGRARVQAWARRRQATLEEASARLDELRRAGLIQPA